MTPSERAELALFGQTRGFHTGSEERDLYAISKATLVRTIEAAEKDVLSGVAPKPDVRWAVNVLLEKIAEKFEGWDTFDLFRSEAAATVRGFKHDLADSAVTSTECGAK